MSPLQPGFDPPTSVGKLDEMGEQRFDAKIHCTFAALLLELGGIKGIKDRGLYRDYSPL